MRYEEYIETNTPWCEKHPAHWQIVKFKSLFSLGKGLNITKADLIEKGVPVISYGQVHAKYNSGVGLNSSLFRYVDKAYANSNNQSLVHENDFIFADTSEDREGCGNCVFVDSDLMLFAGYHSIIARNKGSENNKYVAYQFLTDMWRHQIRSNVDGVKVFSVTKAILNKSSILLPPREEQDQIVRYLDWKVSCINKLIHGYQRQIKLLEETKNTILDNAVFHGIDNRTLSFSGNKLLGNIPEHWNIIKLRSLLTPISVKNHPNEQLLSVVREQGIIVRDIESKESNHNYIPDDLSGYKLVKKGNFVINKMKAWQGSYGVSNYRGIVSPAYYVFGLKHECPEFFHIAIRCKRYVQFFNQASDGIRVGQWDLSMNRMKEIPFVMPPVEEQMKIVEYIKAKFAEIDSVKPMLEKEIELLREYRTRLISDVVTGQMDVCNIEIPEFEVEVDFEADTENETDEDDDTMNEEATTDE